MAPSVQSPRYSAARWDAVVLDQDRQEVRGVDDGEDRVGHAPPPRDGEQNGAQAEEREQVALVGSRRHHEEGNGQDGQGHEQRLRIVTPRGPGADAQQGRDQEAIAKRDCVQAAGHGHDDDGSNGDGRDQERAPESRELGSNRREEARGGGRGIGRRVGDGGGRGVRRRSHGRFVLLVARVPSAAAQPPTDEGGPGQHCRCGQPGQDESGRERPDDQARAAGAGAGIGPGRVV